MVTSRIGVIHGGLTRTIGIYESADLSIAFPSASISRSHFAYDYDISVTRDTVIYAILISVCFALACFVVCIQCIPANQVVSEGHRSPESEPLIHHDDANGAGEDVDFANLS